MNRLSPGWTVLVVLGLLLAPSSADAGLFAKMKDPEDGKFDLSAMLLGGEGGFLPIPIVVTEPAIGVGGGLVLAYFHGRGQETEDPWSDNTPLEERLPPSVTGALGLYTSNDSWVAGALHFGSYKQDRIRYTGVLGGASLNLKFYVADEPLSFNIDGTFLFQEAKFRIGSTDWFLGARYLFLGSESKFDLSGEIPGIKPENLDDSNAGLGLVAFYDSRDTTYTPSKGRKATIIASRYDTALGGNNDYNQLDLDLVSYHRIHPRSIFAFRFVGATTDGDPPFYGLPYIKLRGVPALRYQGGYAASLETELRWQLNRRWSLVGFAGGGAAGSSEGRPDYSDIYAGGLGFRYMLVRLLGMHTGLDVAVGPEETTVYLVFGTGWQR